MNKVNSQIHFVQGAITPDQIAETIASFQSKKNLGAHSSFLGQVRADEVDGKVVLGIEYSAYEDMAIKAFEEILLAALEKFELSSCHVYHSLGMVKTGELCLFVFTSSAHRKIAIASCEYVVEEIKAKVPIFGKEIFEDKTHQWKVNQ